MIYGKFLDPITKQRREASSFIGEKHNRLLILELGDYTIRRNDARGTLKVKCRCDCGAIKYCGLHSVLRGNIKSCGCYNKEKSKKQLLENPISPTTGISCAAAKSLYNTYKKKAEYAKRDFDLTIQEFLDITSKNCNYCGIEPKQIKSKYKKTGDYIYNGIDRIDSSKHYFKENCVPCCGTCNKAKNNMTLSDFECWIKRIYNYNFERKKNVTRPEN